MKRNKPKTGRADKTLATATATGVITALLLSILLTAFLSSLILNGSLREGYGGLIIFMIRAISVLIGALISGRIIKQKCLQGIAVTVLGYFILLLGWGIVFCDGSFKGFLSGVLSVLFGGMAALIILQSHNRRSKRFIKYSS